MPSSLRFVGILIALSVLAAPVSVWLIKRQDSQQARLAATQMTGGNIARGEQAMYRYGCGACHQIPGISGADGHAGPSLQGVGTHTVLAGNLVNTPDQMTRWLIAPQSIDPGSGMPNQNVGARDARDMAAYLYTLRK